MDKNTKVIIAVAIVLIPVFGILGWVLGTEFANKEDKIMSDDTNKQEEVVEALSIEEAETLLEKYHADFYSQYTAGYEEDLKQYLAIKNTKKWEEKKCNEVYNVTTNEYGDDYITLIDGEERCCNDEVITLKYADVNANYKSLFGLQEDMPKTTFMNLLTVYNYVEEIDSFAVTYVCNSGIANPNVELYDVYAVEIIDNQMIISVHYVEFVEGMDDNYDVVYSVELGNEDVEFAVDELMNDEWEVNKNVTDKFFEQYGNKLPVYKYVFEKDDNNWVLVDFYKSLN